MSKQNRREFLKTSVAASAAFSTFAIGGTKSSGAILGANERVNVAVAGVHGRGKSHVSEFSKLENVSVTSIADPDSRLFGDHEGRNCVQDIRKLFDNKDIHAISVATPNHWHSLITIWACQAGKDVYVEKPLSHNVSEGRRCVEAARYHNRMVQHGTQQRSSAGRAKEIGVVHSEKYGKLLVSKGYCCKPRWSIGFKPTGKPPAELDFNIWLGPAPKQPYHGNLVHYNWHWFWDTGNGDTGNQGVHEMDVARWAIKDATLPTKIWSLGGRFGYKDQGQTPNTHISVYEYGDVKLLFETRGLVEKYGMKRMVLNEYYTTDGMIRDGKFYPHGGGKPESIGGEDVPVTPGGPFGSFIQAVRSRKVEDLNADVEIGHYSAALCHLGNISYRLGKQVPFDKKKNVLGDDKYVVESVEAVRDNLKAIGMKLDDASYQLGRVLAFNPQSETFVDDTEADQLLTRHYRAPFVVPERIG